MKKKLALLLIAVMILVPGCSTKIAGTAKEDVKEKKAQNATLDPKNPVKVTFYSYSLSYPTMKAGMEHLIKEFNDTVGKEKGVIVEGIVDESFTKYKSDIAAGNQVDVIQHTFSGLDESKEGLGLSAYEDIFPENELKDHFSNIVPNALKLGQLDGKTYGLAFTFSTPVLYINGKLFEEAGLDPKNPPKTWKDVKEYAMAIKEKTGKDGFGLAPDNGWVSEGVIYSNGGDILSEDRSEALAGSKASVDAYKMWQDLYQSGAHGQGSDKELMEQFMAGNLGMQLQSTSMLSGYQAAAKAAGWELYGSAMPGFEGKEAVPVNSGSALAVRSDSPEKSLAIWEFVKFVTGPRGYTIITSEIGYLPLRTDVADDPKYLKDFIDQNPIIKTNLEQLERIRPVTIWPAQNAQELKTIYTDATVKSVTSSEDVGAIMQDAQNRMNELLKK